MSAVFDVRGSESPFEVMVPPGWAQGRGAFGGLVVAWLARAIEASEVDPARTIRSLSAEIVGPVVIGPAAIRVEPLRIGNGISTYSARLVQQLPTGADEVEAHAVASLGKPRVADRDFSIERPPAARAPEEVDVLPVAPPFGPEFAQHCEFRPLGPLPLSSPGQANEGLARSLGYVRLKERPKEMSVSYLAILADAYWPALYAVETMMRPMATLSFALDVVADPKTLDPEAHYLVATQARTGRDGYIAEERRVFAPDGRLVALNHQTFVVIK